MCRRCGAGSEVVELIWELEGEVPRKVVEHAVRLHKSIVGDVGGHDPSEVAEARVDTGHEESSTNLGGHSWMGHQRQDGLDLIHLALGMGLGIAVGVVAPVGKVDKPTQRLGSLTHDNINKGI